MFDKHDEFVTNLDDLANKDFKISYKNVNETFDNYLTRFIIIIASLDFSQDTQKIYFIKNLSNRLN